MLPQPLLETIVHLATADPICVLIRRRASREPAAVATTAQLAVQAARSAPGSNTAARWLAAGSCAATAGSVTATSNFKTAPSLADLVDIALVSDIAKVLVPAAYAEALPALMAAHHPELWAQVPIQQHEF